MKLTVRVKIWVKVKDKSRKEKKMLLNIGKRDSDTSLVNSKA